MTALMTVLQDNNMEKKVNIRAVMQERFKALKEKGQTGTVKQKKLPPRIKEMLEKAKAMAKEAKPVEKMSPSLFREKMFEQRNKIRTIIENKQKKQGGKP